LGAADLVTKPFDREVLIRVVNRHRRGDGSAQVLVVDDDPRSRDMLRRTLQKEGWTVVEAVNGREALGQLEHSRPALVLLDLLMPEMDGFEVLERMRREDAWRAVPVIIVTAKDLTREEVDRLNGRVVKVLQKAPTGARTCLTTSGPCWPGVRVSARRRHLPSRLATDCTGKSECPKSCMSRTTR
jgi:CheY-like chemotaxis protein